MSNTSLTAEWSNNTPVLITILPRDGFRWRSWGENKAFLSNSLARRIAKALRRYCGGNTQDAVTHGMIRMLEVVEREMGQCAHYPMPGPFFACIKDEIPWMAHLSGEDFAALFRAMLLAHHKITNRREYFFDTQQIVPDEFRVSTPLTSTIDHVRSAFVARYGLTHHDLMADYGFEEARNSDTDNAQKKEQDRVAKNKKQHSEDDPTSPKDETTTSAHHSEITDDVTVTIAGVGMLNLSGEDLEMTG